MDLEQVAINCLQNFMNLSISGTKLELSCAFQDITMGLSQSNIGIPAVYLFKFKEGDISCHLRKQEKTFVTQTSY